MATLGEMDRCLLIRGSNVEVKTIASLIGVRLYYFLRVSSLFHSSFFSRNQLNDTYLLLTRNGSWVLGGLLSSIR